MFGHFNSILPSSWIVEDVLRAETRNATNVSTSLGDHTPELRYDGTTLTINFPIGALKVLIQEQIQQYNACHKRTEFQIIDLCGLRIDIGHNTARISGDWRFRFRERLFSNPLSGGMVHTDWVSMSGWLYQDFDIYVRNSILTVNPTRNEISSSDWYGFLVDCFVSLFDGNGKLRSAIIRGLREINSTNLTELLMGYKHQIMAQTGFNEAQVHRLLTSSESLNADITPESLIVRINPPRDILAQ
ncbi:MAG: hypothetical protein N5P05_004404 (plasmid) [Chroococcopsis gigantea SAG 12.99]|jgi:hypothetical protein|nr:hypothetical protein [Chroococcopsis gigantea SAG 12.99]